MRDCGAANRGRAPLVGIGGRDRGRRPPLFSRSPRRPAAGRQAGRVREAGTGHIELATRGHPERHADRSRPHGARAGDREERTPPDEGAVSISRAAARSPLETAEDGLRRPRDETIRQDRRPTRTDLVYDRPIFRGGAGKIWERPPSTGSSGEETGLLVRGDHARPRRPGRPVGAKTLQDSATFKVGLRLVMRLARDVRCRRCRNGVIGTGRPAEVLDASRATGQRIIGNRAGNDRSRGAGPR